MAAFKARRSSLLSDTRACWCGGAAGNAQLKGKRSRTRAAGWRPTAMVMKKMPDGTGDLAELPRRRVDAPIGDEAADDEFCQAVARVATAFGKQKRSSSTAAEHTMYMRMFDAWLVENKHGSVVEVDTSSMNGKTKSCLPRKASLVPRRRANGSMKVRLTHASRVRWSVCVARAVCVLQALRMLPSSTVSMCVSLVDVAGGAARAAGSVATGDGGGVENDGEGRGTAAYVAAQIGSEVPTACGLRLKIKRTEGQLGFGPYADEPWSL